MNERIKELADQAGYKPLSPPTFADELNEIFIRKFAELIVRECAIQCVTRPIDLCLGGDAYAKKIKEHFGVES